MSEEVVQGQAGPWIDAASHFEIARAVNYMLIEYVRGVVEVEA